MIISEQKGRIDGFQYNEDGFQFQVEAYPVDVNGVWQSFYFPFNKNRPKAGRLSFTFRVNIRHKTTVRIGQLFGVLKKPKCTYRTIRRDCAKRNRR